MTAHPDCVQCLLYGRMPEHIRPVWWCPANPCACMEARRKEERLREEEIYSMYGQLMTDEPKSV